ncbi:hypothetical protein C8Q70DRAFT_968825 [Cubamyces menziesii]|nr:hypothetical protein C8Q70DRAFT_968825 [Cubamyces menziesii]
MARGSYRPRVRRVALPLSPTLRAVRLNALAKTLGCRIRFSCAWIGSRLGGRALDGKALGRGTLPFLPALVLRLVDAIGERLHVTLEGWTLCIPSYSMPGRRHSLAGADGLNSSLTTAHAGIGFGSTLNSTTS